MVGSIPQIFLSWHILWRLVAAFCIPYFLLAMLTTASSSGINEMLGELPPPKVGLVNQAAVPMDLLTELRAKTSLQIIKEEDDLLSGVENDSLDIGLSFDQSTVDSSYQGNIRVYYNSMQNVRAVRKVFKLIDDYENQLVAQNLSNVELDEHLINPIVLDEQDTFDQLLLLGEVINNARGGISNVLNFFFLLLVLWLVRQMVLRAHLYAPKRFGRNLCWMVLGTTLGSVLVFWGVQVGLDIEQSGMIKSLINNLRSLILIDKLYPTLLLWVPTWLFCIGLLGVIMSASSTNVGGHGRTFWAVVSVHVAAMFAFVGGKTITMTALVLPIINIFRLGQHTLRGELDWGNWSIAFGATWFWALVVLVIWWRLHKRSSLTG
ncbi:MAG: hypothetical protein AB8E82_07050 [Aureispira sp.]